MSGGFFALFDDIATLMDDVAVMGKVATKKTAGILGDDLAVNADKASGFPPSRELPVLWAITKGSFLNKVILLPIAFLLSAFAPYLIVPILMAGGVYLAFEGAEKVLEWIFHGKDQEEKEDEEDIDSGDPIELEKKKIDSAIITDFILSIEIVIIALGSVSGQPLSIQIPVVTMVAFLATIGVYALVALIVRLDDMGFALMKMRNEIEIAGLVGKALVSALPLVIRSLTIIGTLAMLLVAGGIFVHHIEALHDTLHMLPLFIAEIVTGFVIGVVAVGIVSLYKKLVSGKSA